MVNSRLSLKEALQIFPEVKKDLPNIKDRVTNELEDIVSALRKAGAIYNETAKKLWKNKEYPLSMEIDSFWRTSPLHQMYKKTSWYLNEIENVGNNNILTEIEIQRAKEYPLEKIINTKKQGKHYICPFHTEKTPSLHITNNLWYCHGCSKGGTTIDFVMRVYNLDFKSAVRAINTY